MKVAVALFTVALIFGFLTITNVHGKSAPSYDTGTSNGLSSALIDQDLELPLSPSRRNRTTADQVLPTRCDVLYDGRCYIVNTVEHRLTLGEARRVCQHFGGQLADIKSETHFHLIRAFMRSMAPMGLTYNNAWTGMEVDTVKRRIKTSTGEWAEYVKWHKDCPKDPVRPYVGMTANIDNLIDYQGFWDAYDTATPLGCICQL